VILRDGLKILKEETFLSSVPAGGEFERQLAAADPDMLRLIVKSFAEALMSAEADAACGAEYGQVSPERASSRNGYRTRGRDTRVGSFELATPKLRSGSCFPDWLLECGRRAEQALMSVVATAYLLGASTRRVERLAAELGVTRLSKSQVSAMAKHLDEQVAAFRNRPLDAGPYPVVWLDALTRKVREKGPVVYVHALVAVAVGVAVGVDGDGTREILGIDVASALRCAPEDPPRQREPCPAPALIPARGNQRRNQAGFGIRTVPRLSRA
jgi:putative transposase